MRLRALPDKRIKLAIGREQSLPFTIKNIEVIKEDDTYVESL